VIKALLPGAAALALLAPSMAAAAAHGEAPAWVITPAADSCRTDLELTGSSGITAQAALVSDGQTVELVFARPDAPQQAFLPIRIDRKPYANLVLRQADGKTSAMELSAETLAALRKGGALQISWLADEPVEVKLSGSDQAVSDLRTCGAQVAQRYRDEQAARRDNQARAAADARAKSLADEQLAVAKAQRQAAEAEAQRSAAEAEHLRAQAEAERQRAQAEAEAERQRDAEQAEQAEAYPYARARGYGQDGGYGYDPRPGYGEGQPYRGW
jgi:hypothetical protein